MPCGEAPPLPNRSFRPALSYRAFGRPPHAAAIPASPAREEGEVRGSPGSVIGPRHARRNTVQQCRNPGKHQKRGRGDEASRRTHRPPTTGDRSAPPPHHPTGRQPTAMPD